MDRQYTGNAYVFLPHIDPRTGGIHGVNVVHRGLDALVEWRADDTAAAPLLLPSFRVDGAPARVGGLRWDRLDGWIPHCELDLGSDLRASITYCAPVGYEAHARGVLLRVVLENRGSTERTVDVEVAGAWGVTLRCVGSARALGGADRLVVDPRGDGFALEAGEGSVGAAIAVVAAGRGAPTLTLIEGDSAEPATPGSERTTPPGAPLRFGLARRIAVGGRRRVPVAFAIAAGPERDGALHTARRLAGQDSGRIVQDARIEATRIARRPAPRGTVELVRRNLLFAVCAGAARAIDDDRQYPVASRMIEHGACAVVDELDVLSGTVPALIIVDPFAAREMILRMFEMYSDRAGTHLRYLSGGVLGPGFSLARFTAYIEAVDRYAASVSDPSLATEPIVQDVMREMDEWLWGRLHRDIFLCSTDLGPSGEPPEYPFTTIGNVRAWRFARALDALWEVREGEPPARFRGAAEDLAAAIWQHCVVEHEGATVFAGSVDLEGNAALYDDPEGSLRWLPHLGFCTPDDPIWTDTMELLHSRGYPLWLAEGRAEGLASRGSPGLASFAALCALLVTPRRGRALDVLSRLELPGGIACRHYDPATGACAEGPWSAAYAGLLAWTLLHEDAPRKRTERR